MVKASGKWTRTEFLEKHARFSQVVQKYLLNLYLLKIKHAAVLKSNHLHSNEISRFTFLLP